jgi:hypothetical protein
MFRNRQFSLYGANSFELPLRKAEEAYFLKPVCESDNKLKLNTSAACGICGKYLLSAPQGLKIKSVSPSGSYAD